MRDIPLRVVLREWGRIGCLGFGGPPAHIALLRQLVVDRRRWLGHDELEDAIAACNLLPGPASTQLAIYTAWRVRGRPGALVGGLAFILPGLVAILALSAVFLASSPPEWVRGAGAGAGAAVAAVAVQAAWALIPASWTRAPSGLRWIAYAAAGAAAAAAAAPWVVLVLLAAGALELTRRRAALHAWPVLFAASAPSAGLAWVALKVGALSYGGGFVIIPLMQGDAVDRHHWMTAEQFLNAVALGQVTPGPVVHTVAAVGYAAAGVPGALLAAAIAFAPSFAFVLAGAGRFGRLRAHADVRAFLDGAGPAAIGAILGSAFALARALEEPWQAAILAAAAVALLAARRGVVETLVAAGIAGALLALAGAPAP
ncbi:chromate transporter [Candidatus Solirubrobacter pratensis]|uniref:chromate transporter n=1 Tax=Candidatus Solirubrobacter pratensis TaxID=1298857 RepID=UPI00040D8286|nr:chromate transporter [Candidatus Solirubrobacter pratensis]